MAKVEKLYAYDFLTYVKIKEKFELLGLGVTSKQVSMNANVSTEQYVHQKTAYNSVDSYAPSIATSQTAFKGDPVYDLIFDIYYNRKTGTDAELEVINAYIKETVGADTCKAERQTVAIEITSFGGDAGNPSVIEYTIHYNGNAELGTAKIDETKGIVFTPAE